MKKILCASVVLVAIYSYALAQDDKTPKRFVLEKVETSLKETFEDHPNDGVMIINSTLDAVLDFESNEIPNFNYVYDDEKKRYVLFFPSGVDRTGINQIVTVRARGYTYQQFTERIKLSAGDVVYYKVYDKEAENKKAKSKDDTSPWLWVGIAGGIAIGIAAAIVIATQLSSSSGGSGTFTPPPPAPSN